MVKKLTTDDVIEIRRLCCLTSTTYEDLARKFNVSESAVRSAANGRTWGDLECEWEPYSGDPLAREFAVEDEVEMMEMRVDCATHDSIANDMGMDRKQVRSILMYPSEAAHKKFFHRNGYRFVDDVSLSSGRLTVDDVIRMLELKLDGYSFERISMETGFSTGYCEQVVYCMRGAQKLELAKNYMEVHYGDNWKTWGDSSGT